jgi:hypothetical protein
MLYWLYFALMESSANQATFGKMALGIKVTDLQGNSISFGKASGRYFAKLVSACTLGVGYVMAGFTKRRQALHDMMVGCLVTNKPVTADDLLRDGPTLRMASGAIAALILLPIIGSLAAVGIPLYQNHSLTKGDNSVPKTIAPPKEVRSESAMPSSSDYASAFSAADAAYPRLTHGLVQAVIEQDNGFRIGGTDPTEAAIASAARLDATMERFRGNLYPALADWYWTVGLRTMPLDQYVMSIRYRRDAICMANNNCGGFFIAPTN